MTAPLPGDLCFVSTAGAKCVWVCQTKPRSSSNTWRCVSLSLGCGAHSCTGWTHSSSAVWTTRAGKSHIKMKSVFFLWATVVCVLTHTDILIVISYLMYLEHFWSNINKYILKSQIILAILILEFYILFLYFLIYSKWYLTVEIVLLVFANVWDVHLWDFCHHPRHNGGELNFKQHSAFLTFFLHCFEHLNRNSIHLHCI